MIVGMKFTTPSVSLLIAGLALHCAAAPQSPRVAPAADDAADRGKLIDLLRRVEQSGHGFKELPADERAATIAWLRARRSMVLGEARQHLTEVIRREGATFRPAGIYYWHWLWAAETADPEAGVDLHAELFERAQLALMYSDHLTTRGRGEVEGLWAHQLYRPDGFRSVRNTILGDLARLRSPAAVQAAKELVEAPGSTSLAAQRYLLPLAQTRPDLAKFLLEKRSDPKSRLYESGVLKDLQPTPPSSLVRPSGAERLIQRRPSTDEDVERQELIELLRAVERLGGKIDQLPPARRAHAGAWLRARPALVVRVAREHLLPGVRADGFQPQPGGISYALWIDSTKVADPEGATGLLVELFNQAQLVLMFVDPVMNEAPERLKALLGPRRYDEVAALQAFRNQLLGELAAAGSPAAVEPAKWLIELDHATSAAAVRYLVSRAPLDAYVREFLRRKRKDTTSRLYESAALKDV